MDGIGWFTYHVLKRWVEQYPQHHFYFIFDRDYDSSFVFGENVTPMVVYPPARHPILWYIWYEIAIPRILKKINPDIFISLDTYTSIRWKGKKLTGIHDVAFALFDGHLGIMAQSFLRIFTPRYIECSDVIATVSHTTKKDLIEIYQCPEDKIVVSHNAPAVYYQPLPAHEIALFKEEHTAGTDFFLFVGSIHPRKNVLGLLKSFERFKDTYPSEMKLVLIGRMSWKCDDVASYLQEMKWKEDVITLLHSTPEEISKWMASATALMMTSFYEGFGVPLVEAMASGVPIICSNVSSMPEVAGSAAILVSPENPIEIAEAMHQLATNVDLRNKLIAHGREQVKQYHWDTAADILWDVVEKLIEHDGK